MTNKWQTLFEEIEIIENQLGSEIWGKDEINTFEKNTGRILPNDYKMFCQIWGTGKFGNYMNIYCPSTAFSQVHLEAIKLDINAIKDNIESYSYIKYSKKGNVKFDVIEELINSSFVFGDNVNSDVVFWDLRTFKVRDKSYDIYITNSDCFDGVIYKIGRDFYEFVYDFCLGRKSFKILPKSMQPLNQDIRYTFTPFNPSRSD